RQHRVCSPPASAAGWKPATAVTETRPRLSWVTSGALAQGLPADHVAMRAETTVQIPAGGFDLLVLSDDGVRVWVDNALVIDRWSIHETAVDRTTLSAGSHRVSIEYCHEGSW